MIALMTYAVMVGVLTAVAARAAESAVRALGWPVRWVWATALLTCVALAALAPFRGQRFGMAIDESRLPFVHTNASAPAPAPVHVGDRLMQAGAAAERAVVAPVERGLLLLRAHSSPGANMAAGLIAAALTLGAFVVIAFVERRFRTARRRWPVHAIAGVPVRVSPTLGPVVIGVTRPEIVVPAWLLERADAEQQLAVSHEREHVRARDPLLLRAAGAAVALMPWNPAVWYAYTRLRLAIELDCDARLLRGGAAARPYGTLLIDMAERAAPLRLAALALADDSSHLYQRILAMKSPTPRFVYGRALVAAVVAATAILAACDATMPTQADVQSMDAASAERALVGLKAARDTFNLVYTIDGQTATAKQAYRLRADTLLSIAFARGANGRTDTLHLRTTLAAVIRDTVAALEARVAREAALDRRAGAGLANAAFVRRGDSTGLVRKYSFRAAANPVVTLINGVIATEAQVRAINPRDIDNIEIVKGAAAGRTYPSIPDAEKGVMSIVTKSGGRR